MHAPRRISGRSMTLVMLDGKEDREHYFFDAASFYLRRGPLPTAVPLSQITSVTRTSDKIYGRYVWQVCFSKASGRKCVTFTNNLTLFNRIRAEVDSRKAHAILTEALPSSHNIPLLVSLPTCTQSTVTPASLTACSVKRVEFHTASINCWKL